MGGFVQSAYPQDLEQATESGADPLLFESNIALSQESYQEPVVLSPAQAELIFPDEDAAIKAADLVSASTLTALPDPTYIIEDIQIRGNSSTLDSYILKNAGLKKGQHINLELLQNARLQLLSTNLFESVGIQLQPGTQKSFIKLTLHLKEQNYLWVEDIFLGSSKKSIYWQGFDIAYNNAFGAGQRIRMAFVANTQSDYALELSYGAPNILDSGFSLQGTFFAKASHEDLFEHRLQEKHSTFTYERLGANLELAYNYKYLKLKLALQSERFNTSMPPDIPYTEIQYAPHNVHTSLALSIAYDSTDHVFMPQRGLLFQLDLAGSHKAVLSDFSYYKVQFNHLSNFTFKQNHTFRLRLFAGIVAPTAPFYELFYISDYYDLSPSRTLGINMSRARPYDLFNTAANNEDYEHILARLSLEYAYRFKFKAPELKALEIFLQPALLSSISTSNLFYHIGIIPANEYYQLIPINASFDFGLRFATTFGNFSLSLSKLIPLFYR